MRTHMVVRVYMYGYMYVHAYRGLAYGPQYRHTMDRKDTYTMEDIINQLGTQCCAYTTKGEQCVHNNAAIVGTVWYKGTVCYGLKSLPMAYVGAGWSKGMVRVCGTHARMLREGKALNMQGVVAKPADTLPEVPTKKGITCTKGHNHPSLEDVRACYGAPAQEVKQASIKSGDWYERKDNVRSISNPYLRGEYLHYSKSDHRRADKLRRHGNDI